MIYFLINNAYQYYDVIAHVESGVTANLVVIPHSIEKVDESRFDEIHHFSSPWLKRNWIWVLPAVKARKKIDRALRPKSNDVLVLYTEYEPLNQYIAARFKASGATVLMIEDGGIASYTQNAEPQAGKLSAMQAAYQFWTRLVLGYGGYRLFKIGSIVYPRMEDELIDAIVYYRPAPILRKIKRIVATRSVREVTLNRNVVIFLNQPLYERYLSEAEYLSILKKSILSLDAFSTLYFKFHPREKPFWKERILAVVKNYRPDAVFLDEREPIESSIEKYAAGFAASFFSSALMALREMGVQPIYLYRMCKIDDLGSLPRLNDLLEGLNYNFPLDESDLSPAYESGLKMAYSETNVSEVLKQLNDLAAK